MIKRIILAILGAIPNSLIWIWSQLPEGARISIERQYIAILGPRRAAFEKGVTDFWTYAVSGLTGLLIPVDPAAKVSLSAVLNILLNAARRAWYANT